MVFCDIYFGSLVFVYVVSALAYNCALVVGLFIKFDWRCGWIILYVSLHQNQY